MDKTRTCRICGKSKPIVDFYVRENGKRRTECILCQQQRVKQWYKNTKAIRKEKRKEYLEQHRTELNGKQRKYYLQNRAEILQKHYARRKAQRRSSVRREIETMRWTIQGIMHNGWSYSQPQNTKRKEELEKIFGCTITELKEYLYETWTKEYKCKWNNELFHIDHIVPLQTAKSVNDVQKLCHYSNLRMLKPEDNLSRPKLQYSEPLSLNAS